MLGIFYGKRDKAEIKGWIKKSNSSIEQTVIDLQVTLQEIQRAQNAPNFAEEISELRKEIDTLKNQPDFSAPIQAEIQAQLPAIKSEIIQQVRADFQSQIDALNNEISTLKEEIKKLKAEKQIQPPPPPPPTFYLKPNDEVFIPADRKNIPAQIRKALNVDDMKNFLLANDTPTSKKFQKLINTHANSVKNFVDKFKLNDLDDEELSETVTSKYFKIFQPIIFDNLIVAIKRGLKTNDKFYTEFLIKLNAYLESCGIYTVNAKSGGKATDEDYTNMSPQPIKISDKNQNGIINDIERLPYKINYLDEFGEKKFFQYNGIMNIFKAV